MHIHNISSVVFLKSQDCKGLELLFSDFEKSLLELKSRKSEGIDNIHAELLKALGSKGK